MKNKIKIWIVIGIVVLVGIIWTFNVSGGSYDSFAQCLTSKGVKMYGTDWCGNCQDQKKSFGSSFQYIDYINCDKDRSACSAASVKGYPTWHINNRVLLGTQPLQILAQISECELRPD